MRHWPREKERKVTINKTAATTVAPSQGSYGQRPVAQEVIAFFSLALGDPLEWIADPGSGNVSSMAMQRRRRRRRRVTDFSIIAYMLQQCLPPLSPAFL